MRWLLAIALLGCHSHDEDGGHGHGHGHSHGEAEAADHHAPTFQVTRWTEDHEVFVDLAPPVLGQPIQYAVHVTRLADGRPVESAMVGVDWLAGGTTAASFVAFEARQPGLFVFSAPGPENAGEYSLQISVDGEAVDFGTFGVGTEARAPVNETPEIRFPKESQWQIPLRVEHPAERQLGRAVRLSAVVEPAPGQTRALTAPAAGFLEWSRDVPLPVGARIQPGQVVATIFPAATDMNWSELRLAVREGEVERDRAQTEVRRLRPLVEQGLVAGRQLDEANARLKRARARLESARQQRDQTQGKRPAGIPVTAAVGGVITELDTRDGAVVTAGQPLARVVSEDHWHLHADVLPAEVGGANGILGAWVGADQPVDLSGLKGRALVADPHTGLAPIEFEAPDGDWILGARVPVRLMVGPAEPVLSVPRSAIVDINTRPYVFIMEGGESFSRRQVQLGPGDATHVGVAGLTTEDRVVVKGGFDVYVASLSGTLESHTH